ncbi:hypothetical protein BVG16_16325 [Paenibacillus selenitireducens]|uniref:Phage baseplate assembly protein V n=1 Tax=Paenibacillus selenitireducens TaxID=1324314 RepID=A0A1T2XAL1_9BACL|nr:hypothetical protein [Paenibacillus selenitireducens]OPA76736.1 hypothetical protein BVG16_16325 [Paenibacillus selenitireducens]
MQWVRHGEVSTVNAENMTVRVVFNGLDTSVSNDLTVLVPPGRSQYYMLPEVGDEVICLFTESEGFCIAVYQTVIPEASPGTWGIWFDDDNQIVYENGKLTIKAAEILLNGKVSTSDLKITGNLDVSGKINGYTPGSGDL